MKSWEFKGSNGGLFKQQQGQTMFSVNLCREDGGGSAFCFPPYSTRLECPTICR